MARTLQFKSINLQPLEGDIVIGGDLEVGGDVEIAGTLDVTGTTNFDGTVAVAGVFGALSGTFTSTVTATRFRESAPLTTATASQNYTVLATDRLVRISTTGAGNRTITFPSMTIISTVTIVMTAFNTANYTAVVPQGTVTWAAVGDVATFISAGDATNTWYLIGAPQGAVVT